MNPKADVTASIIAFPVGTIIAYAFPATNLPTGWLLCDGSTFDAAQYPVLYQMLGNSNVMPDLRGYFLRGLDPAGKVDPDGPKRAPRSAQGHSFQQHNHGFWRTAWYLNECVGGSNKVTAKQNGDWDDFFTENATSNAGDAETRPVNIAVNYLMYAGLQQTPNKRRKKAK